jgi:magnesium transporter
MEKTEEQIRQEWWDKTYQSLRNKDIDSFRSEFLELHPFDQALFFLEQPKEHRMLIYTYLSPEEMALVIENIDLEDIKPIFTEMDPRFASQILGEMATDDAVDLLQTLNKTEVASFLTIMDKEAANEIKELLHYEEKTAGSIMTTQFVSVDINMRVKEAMVHLRKVAPDAETIYYVYVLDEDKKLVGVISLRDIIIAHDDTFIKDIMSDRIVYVEAAEDQENVARTMRDYDLLALPVVDFQNHLLGIITVDDIMDVMIEEASEDYSRLAGVSDMEKPDMNPLQAAKTRLPWLIILLFLGMFTASLIGKFEATLEKVAVLAIFIPLIAGMAGNTGTQALAVAVRSIALGENEKDSKWKLLLREAGTGVITGSICGIVITLIIYLWKGSFYLGLLVGLSIMFTLIVATIAGALIPLFMHKMNIDPAVASGPFITTINDIISILIYLGMASVFMDLLL